MKINKYNKSNSRSGYTYLLLLFFYVRRGGRRGRGGGVIIFKLNEDLNFKKKWKNFSTETFFYEK